MRTTNTSTTSEASEDAAPEDAKRAVAVRAAVATEPAAAPPKLFLDIDTLIDEHSADLFSLAYIILGDHREAEDVVAHLLSDACRRPHRNPDRGSRRNLSRRLYLSCTRVRIGPRLPFVPADRPVDHDAAAVTVIMRLGELSEQQRATLALCLFGDHTYEQVADLIALPAPVVLQLLRSGLREIRQGPGSKS